MPALLDEFVVFDEPGVNAREGSWYGSIVTNDITIRPNPEISTSASMFLDNTEGQVWEFFSDFFGNFGVFDKAREALAFTMSVVSDSGTYYDVSIAGGLATKGGIQAKLFTQTASTIFVGTEDYTTLLNGTTTCQLPDASLKPGLLLNIKQIAAGSVSVTTTSSQTIDGAASYSLSAQYKYVTVQSDGSNWFIIANN